MAELRVACRRCGREMVVDDQVPLPPDFPFCSDRCRLIDLGAWFEESYRVAGGADDGLDADPDPA